MFGVMDTGMKIALAITAAVLITLATVVGRWLARR